MNYVKPTLRLRTFTAEDYMSGAIATSHTITCHDVVNVPKIYDMSVYKKVVKELNDYNEENNGKLIIPWHKGNHLIANDRHKHGAWKSECPTITSLISDMCNAFNVTANATRVNVYSNTDNKPFHHDRSAFTPGLTQNFTIALSLGATREIGFKYAKYKKEPHKSWTPFPRSLPSVIISNVCENGSIYAFARDVNCEFQHGVIGNDTANETEPGPDRVSIIVWGTKYDMDISNSRVSSRSLPTPFELGVRVKNVKQVPSINT